MPEPQVIVVNPSEGADSPPSQESSTQSTEQAVEYGQLLERHRQMSEENQELRARLSNLEEMERAKSSQLDTMSNQLSTVLSAIQQAAAEEEEAEPEADVTLIAPVVEPSPEPEPEPERKPSRWERMCDAINGM